MAGSRNSVNIWVSQFILFLQAFIYHSPAEKRMFGLLTWNNTTNALLDGGIKCNHLLSHSLDTFMLFNLCQRKSFASEMLVKIFNCHQSGSHFHRHTRVVAFELQLNYIFVGKLILSYTIPQHAHRHTPTHFRYSANYMRIVVVQETNHSKSTWPNENKMPPIKFCFTQHKTVVIWVDLINLK